MTSRSSPCGTMVPTQSNPIRRRRRRSRLRCPISPSGRHPPPPHLPPVDQPTAAPSAPFASQEPAAEEPEELTVVRDEDADAPAEPIVDHTATREPLGGPYVVSESGAPRAEQAVIAYEREPPGAAPTSRHRNPSLTNSPRPTPPPPSPHRPHQPWSQGPVQVLPRTPRPISRFPSRSWRLFPRSCAATVAGVC